MARRTLLLLIGLAVLALIAAVCVLLSVRGNGLAGSGVFFV